MSAQPIEIHLIADGTGDTAARVARAAQLQFTTHPTRVIRHPLITTAGGLRRAIESISGAGTAVVVFSTLVDDGLRALVSEICDELSLAHCDLLGPAIEALEKASGDRAERVPARQVGMDPDYFKRIAAMEFAVKHDDGQANEGLVAADIVLVGVSRTGKTPLSMYLGYLGYKTANVPLVKGIAPPPQLWAVDRWRLVGLTIDPERLAAIRHRRVAALGTGRAGSRDGYAALTSIYEELDQAAALHRRLGCPAIDTTTLALEEAAGRVIELVEERRRALAATS
jgi:[pyruvate, water dikinase]-phosphate phosphotransferase / [pyruvate, water dikinase] kinase